MDNLRISKISIGGGPGFLPQQGWLNLEEVESQYNPRPFVLEQTCCFPVPDNSIDLIYSSHCLEHLDTPTVCRVLSEAYRALQKDAFLILKLPDFEDALNRWKNGDSSLMATQFGIDSVVATWGNRRIVDSLDYRTAMLFCAFWNNEYGDHYSGRTNTDGNAYNGPSIIPLPELQLILRYATPSQISAHLRSIVLRDETEFKFNHQNAWSRNELRVLLEQIGFEVQTFNKSAVMNICSAIPDIRLMENISMYCWATKR